MTNEGVTESLISHLLSCLYGNDDCGGRVSLDGVAARGLVNGAHRIQVIAWQSALLTGLNPVIYR